MHGLPHRRKETFLERCQAVVWIRHQRAEFSNRQFVCRRDVFQETRLKYCFSTLLPLIRLEGIATPSDGVSLFTVVHLKDLLGA
jgi:hypothetical protein